MNNERQSTFSTFMSGLSSGVSGTMHNIANTVRPSNYAHAQRQVGQFTGAIRNPEQTRQAVQNAVGHANQTLNTRQTVANTLGDMTGSSMALLGLTVATTALLRRPYMASRFGQAVGRTYDRTFANTTGAARNFFQHERVRNFGVTRPLAFGVGATYGAMNFIGGAEERHNTAQENQRNHPQIHGALYQGGIHEVLASPVSRGVRNRSNSF